MKSQLREANRQLAESKLENIKLANEMSNLRGEQKTKIITYIRFERTLQFLRNLSRRRFNSVMSRTNLL